MVDVINQLKDAVIGDEQEEMNGDTVIRVRGLRKNYRILKGDEWKKGLFQINRMKDYTVIDGIDLEVKKGEVVGILGRNGCGKSTFMKLVSRIIQPTEGTVEIRGKIASILEMSMGFHNDLTGKENIILRSELYGIPRSQAIERLDDIVKYADIGEFINNPVRTYSSGMRSRLAFAIMVNVDADIFLVDEALSTGDVAFASKASEHLKSLTRNGKTILFTSHSMGTIESTCTRAIWIDKGKIYRDGPAEEVCAEYNRAIMESFELTVDLAEGGAPSAQYRLATYYRDGVNVEKDYGLYIKWLKEAVSREHTIAMAEYADILVEDGTSESMGKAIELYRSAADNGNYDARRKYSSLISGAYKELPKILETARIIAESGDHFDQYLYGDLILKTALRRSDYRKAFEVLSAAEENGDIDAKYQTAQMYRDGTGVERNIEVSIRKLEELSIDGHPRAMTMLADMYYSGKFVQKDTAKAFEWYYRSACVGNAKSQYQIGEMYREGVGVEKNEELANEWFGNYARSMIAGPVMDLTDSMRHCPEELPVTSNDLVLYCADAYYNKALIRAANIYSKGRAAPKDDRKTFEYTKKAAELIGKSKAALADCYSEGIGVEKDQEKALALYKLAADTGDADAMMKLAQVYKNNESIEGSSNLYRTYVRMAAKNGNREAREITGKWDKRNAARRKKSEESNEPDDES